MTTLDPIPLQNADKNYLGKTLEITVQPCEVRLKTANEKTEYAWKVDDLSIKPLFQKQLSKHTVGVYIKLCENVGQTFRAVRREGLEQDETDPQPGQTD